MSCDIKVNAWINDWHVPVAAKSMWAALPCAEEQHISSAYDFHIVTMRLMKQFYCMAEFFGRIL